MSLLSTYEKFLHINREFIDFIEKLVADNFESFTEEQIKMNLTIALKNYESLKFESDEIQAEGNEINNLNNRKNNILNSISNIIILKRRGRNNVRII